MIFENWGATGEEISGSVRVVSPETIWPFISMRASPSEATTAVAAALGLK